MFQIICLAGLAGAAVGLVLIVLSYLKDRSLLIPYIIFFVCIAVFGVAAFLGIREADKTADEPSAQVSDGIASDDPSQEPSDDPDQGNSQGPSDQPQPSEAPSDTPASNPPTSSTDANMLSIGDSVTLGDWDILVTDFYYTDKIDMGSYTYYDSEEGNQFAVAVVRVTNNGTELDTFLPPIALSSDIQANIYYAGKYEYSSSILLGVNEDLHNQTLNPLTSKEGIIAFSVPDLVVNSEDSLSLTFSADRDAVTFSLR